jgi:hypothetical protein
MERRVTSRRVPGAGECLSRVRLRIGSELTVLDISDSGTLVEGCVRLSPGSRIDVHVVSRTGRVLVRTTVARAHVASVRADVLTYHVALAFDQPVDTHPPAG